MTDAAIKNSKQCFDSTGPIQIKLQGPEGLKEIVVRFPSDEEWIERQRKRKIIIKRLGRNISETFTPDAEENDLVLLQKIRVDKDGPEIDAFEAERIIEDISKCEVEDIVQEGTVYKVSIRVPGAITEHRLRMPSSKELITYRRNFSRALDLPFNRQRLIVNLGAAGELDAKLRQGTEGYKGPVPIIHQAIAVQAVVGSLDSGFGAAGSENF